MAAYLDHPALGRVFVTPRSNTRSVTARWKKGNVWVNVPLGLPPQQVMAALDSMAQKMISRRPTLLYSEDSILEFDDFAISFQRSPHPADGITARIRLPQTVVFVGMSLDFEAENVQRAISRILERVAKELAPAILIPRARGLAQRVGASAAGWSIGRGHRVLGTCRSNRHISLSHLNMFLPTELRDYIIMHELAHLTEMNHSPRFHAILNGYLDGRETELVARLNHYKWPIYR